MNLMLPSVIRMPRLEAGRMDTYIAPSFLALVSFLIIVSSNSDVDTLLAIKAKWQAVLPSWVDRKDFCETWEGVTCNPEGRVLGLSLTNKGLKGHIPSEIGNLVALTYLNLSNINGSAGPWNQIQGDLSAVEKLSNLQLLNLSYNVLETEFPSAVLRLSKLTSLDLSNTFLTGPFPLGLSNLSNLRFLYLGNCSMTGDLPAELGGLPNLVELSLWNNEFNSSIPIELGNLVHLTYLNLHTCGLWGGLPSEFSNLMSLQRLKLYNNFLTGFIPDSWRKMVNLVDLRLEYNYLTRSFPSWMHELASLRYLDLAYNQLYGDIPNLNNTHLLGLRMECNFFTGDWPVKQPNMTLFYAGGNCFSNISWDADTSEYTCNRQVTCGDFFHQLNGICPPCPTNQIPTNMELCICGEEENSRTQSEIGEVGKIIGPLLAGCFLLFTAFFMLAKWKNSKDHRVPRDDSQFSDGDSDNSWVAPQGVTCFSLQEISKATQNFHKDYKIGAGAFGEVFYGTLDSGKKVAIKRAFTSGRKGSLEFHNEISLLSRLHHRNLVHLEGFCEDSGIQVLVYEHMANGNLHAWLFNNNEIMAQSWYKRLEIAADIAEGLEYLHYFADPTVIHRDVKPNNILLNDNLVAKLSDFGHSKVTWGSQTHISTTLSGTAGYIDPQYLLKGHLTTSSDVYSFGMVLLELVTGQMAIDHNRLDEDNLAAWVRLRLNDQGIDDVVDPRLGKFYSKQIYYEITKLAICCTSFDKDSRPSMKDVLKILTANIQLLSPHPCKAVHSGDSDDNQQILKAFSGTYFEGVKKAEALSNTSSSIEMSNSSFQISIIEPR